MKVIVTGATGMVGKGVLLECLDHPKVEKVLSIGRSELKMNHPKLKELIHNDFSSFESVKEELKAFDACFACMGVSSAGINETQFTQLTYDYTMALAKVFYSKNPNAVFTYVSGEGTDSTEKGNVMWARVKGKTENEILNLGFRAAYMFRPGAILPLRGIKSRTKLYQFVYDYFTWLLKLLKSLMPNKIVNTTQIGLAMINAVEYGYNKSIIKPYDIIKLAEKES